MTYRLTLFLLALVGFGCVPQAAFAASGLPGAAMGWVWAIPFAGLLVTIATGPLLFPGIWHHHYGKIAAGWALAALVPLALTYGLSVTLADFVHAMLAEYLSFIVLLFALYTVAGGLLVTGNLGGRPLSNTLVLAFGTVIASIVGTTGAAMILVRPLIRANAERRHNVHVIVFFIFLVANIGGALSPLGDPPLFVGFLRGVDFFWPAMHLWRQTVIAALLVLGVFVALDLYFARRDPAAPVAGARIKVYGLVNLPLLATIIAAILASALWKPGVVVTIYGTALEAQNIARDVALVAIALLSLWLTPDEHRAANDFTWEPIREVAKLFAAIFVCIIPVLAMLNAGRDGVFAGLLDAVTTKNGNPHEAVYFWLTGSLSAFLDNAPTYLVFFELAGGNVRELMGPLAGTLAAISLGAVFMGALTYIGNAPNLMVYAIASERGIKMPSFFGYIVWALCVLVPLFVILTLLPMAPILSLP
ncbi:MAG: sodium:proton antiporter [Candidatus Eiseniibacteriota bacterium]|jgi:Na+/H+ antiporter NhaD/arsenite permease-like protein